jgi:hypothetical protein
MAISPRWRSAFLVACVCVLHAGQASAQVFEISSGGTPTISGALGGVVTGSSTGQTLSVAVNFGEVSPVNRSRIVKVVVPILIRASRPYQIRVSASANVAADSHAVQTTDIGFGIVDLRPFGVQPRGCTNHTARPPFANDPAVTVTADAAGRASYLSSLASLGGQAIVASGPAPGPAPAGNAGNTSGNNNPGNNNNGTNNGYVFDAVLAITPQFYSAGGFSAVILFTIEEGPTVPCS